MEKEVQVGGHAIAQGMTGLKGRAQEGPRHEELLLPKGSGDIANRQLPLQRQGTGPVERNQGPATFNKPAQFGRTGFADAPAEQVGQPSRRSPLPQLPETLRGQDDHIVLAAQITALEGGIDQPVVFEIIHIQDETGPAFIDLRQIAGIKSDARRLQPPGRLRRCQTAGDKGHIVDLRQIVQQPDGIGDDPAAAGGPDLAGGALGLPEPVHRNAGRQQPIDHLVGRLAAVIEKKAPPLGRVIYTPGRGF
ncbi:MAG: hypothetical protein BWY77_01695 [bacterium ADurb.Bin431]|nr:MAG: hypothetical protein BWY77_01695 [bacterium ADurb.Bin431]